MFEPHSQHILFFPNPHVPGSIAIFNPESGFEMTYAPEMGLAAVVKDVTEKFNMADNTAQRPRLDADGAQMLARVFIVADLAASRDMLQAGLDRDKDRVLIFANLVLNSEAHMFTALPGTFAPGAYGALPPDYIDNVTKAIVETVLSVLDRNVVQSAAE